jgi:hypothetical protein
VPSPSGIAHTGLAFANPMAEAAVDEAIAALPGDLEALVLETGCGTGEILRHRHPRVCTLRSTRLIGATNERTLPPRSTRDARGQVRPAV